jgi:hypothetical protein
MENKQTAVDWLIKQLHPTISIWLSDAYIEELIEQAKEMEKKQIKDAFKEGEDNVDNDGLIIDKSAAEQYYNETFKQDGNK